MTIFKVKSGYTASHGQLQPAYEFKISHYNSNLKKRVKFETFKKQRVNTNTNFAFHSHFSKIRYLVILSVWIGLLHHGEVFEKQAVYCSGAEFLRRLLLIPHHRWPAQRLNQGNKGSHMLHLVHVTRATAYLTCILCTQLSSTKM